MRSSSNDSSGGGGGALRFRINKKKVPEEHQLTSQRGLPIPRGEEVPPFPHLEGWRGELDAGNV